jgi:uncharacterized membrane protein YadS
LCLIPLILTAAILLNRRETKSRLPGFILFFVLFSVVGSVSKMPADWLAGISALSRFMLVAALFLMGLEISRKSISNLNYRGVTLGICLWLLVLPTTFWAVKLW